MKTALVIFVLLALLGVPVGWAVWGWEQTAGTAMGFHGWMAMILGIVFTIIVECGLMGLKEAMKQAGVLDTPTIYFLESID